MPHDQHVSLEDIAHPLHRQHHPQTTTITHSYGMLCMHVAHLLHKELAPVLQLLAGVQMVGHVLRTAACMLLETTPIRPGFHRACRAMPAALDRRWRWLCAERDGLGSPWFEHGSGAQTARFRAPPAGVRAPTSELELNGEERS